MISVNDLTKRYGEVTAVDEISFGINEGEMLALLGTNGAGKSTTISCMTTILQFDSGVVVINGNTVGRDDQRIRRDIGIVFQESLLDPLLSVRENLRLKARFYQLPERRVTEVENLVDISDIGNRRYGKLSGGQRRRVDIARALLPRPSVLFLDEPTAGLDPQNREHVWRAMAALRNERGMTILLTTHYMAETEAADQVVIIDSGRVVASGTPMELRSQHSSPQLTIMPRAGTAALSTVSQAAAQTCETWYEEGGAIHLGVGGAQVALDILNELRDVVADFEYRPGSMDDVFLNLTQQGKQR